MDYEDRLRYRFDRYDLGDDFLLWVDDIHGSQSRFRFKRNLSSDAFDHSFYLYRRISRSLFASTRLRLFHHRYSLYVYLDA